MNKFSKKTSNILAVTYGININALKQVFLKQKKTLTFWKKNYKYRINDINELPA